MKMTWEQAEHLTGGGNTFFKLQDGQVARVRFLYNVLGEIEPLCVHSVNQGNNYATIDCSRGPGEPMENCKWCASGNNPVSRVVLPLYNMDTNEIQYWVRSATWVKGTLLPCLEEIPQNQPISGQTFKIQRIGKTMQDTTYNVRVEMGSQNDMKTKEQFGEVKDAYESNIIKPNDYTFPVNTQLNNTNNTNNFNNNNEFTSTRRTAQIF